MNHNARQQIEQLHTLYAALTGMQILLTSDRERVWFEWQRGGFVQDDLRLVVRLIRSGIQEGKRNAGALKFSNLIGMPDRFEEDLALAKSAQRANRPAKPAPPQRVATAAGPRTEQPVEKVSEKALAELRTFREGNK